jgi:hypothetical protein
MGGSEEGGGLGGTVALVGISFLMRAGSLGMTGRDEELEEEVIGGCEREEEDPDDEAEEETAGEGG